jgi:DNA-binding response OmpR family regulator
MNLRLFEIRNKIDNLLHQVNLLRAEEWSIVQLLIPETERCEEPLDFNDTKRIIRWNNGMMRVGPKMYRLLKTLWSSRNHRTSLEKIEQKVWKVGTQKKPFIDRHTIFTLICRAQNELKKNHFPYEIITGKNFSTQEIKGFRLVYAPRKKNN